MVVAMSLLKVKQMMTSRLQPRVVAEAAVEGAVAEAVAEATQRRVVTNVAEDAVV